MIFGDIMGERARMLRCWMGFGKDYPKTLTIKEEKYQHKTELTSILSSK